MNKLITESLVQKDITYVLPFSRTLITKIEAQWIEWIHEYLIKYGQPPSLERFEQQFSHNFTAVSSIDPLGDIFDLTLKAKRNIYVRSQISSHAQDLKDGDDPTAIIEKIHSAITGVDLSCVTSDSWDKSSYFRTAEAILTGIPAIDRAIGGIVNGDLMYIAGRPGDGKTTLLLHMIAKWYWQGKRVLVISNEIRYDDMLFKIDAILAQMQVSEKRLGRWEDDSRRKLNFLQYIQGIAPGQIICPKGPVSKPSSVRGMIAQYKPDVVCIDGAYLMSPTGSVTTDWSELAAVSRELKQIANAENIRIIGVLQANRDSEFKQTTTLGALAGTDGYGQDADIVLLLKSQGLVDGDKEVQIHTPKNRNGAYATALIRYDFARMTVYESNQ